MIKRINILLIVACIILSLCACRNNESNETNPTKDSTTTPTNVVDPTIVIDKEGNTISSIDGITLTVNDINIHAGMTVKECIDAGLVLCKTENDQSLIPNQLNSVVFKLNEEDNFSIVVMVDSQSNQKMSLEKGVVVGFSFSFADCPDDVEITILGLNKNSAIDEFEKLLGPKNEVETDSGTAYLWYEKDMSNSEYNLYCCVSKLTDSETIHAITIHPKTAMLSN